MRIKPEWPEHIKHAAMLGNLEAANAAKARAREAPRQPPIDYATPPPGKAPITSIAQWEAFPEKEQLERLDELNPLLEAGQV